VGHAIADTALHALGFAAYLFPVYLGYVTVALLRPGAENLGGLRLAGAGLLVVTVAALAGVVTQGRAIVRGGGWLGGFVGTALRELVGRPGAYRSEERRVGKECRARSGVWNKKKRGGER